MRVQVLDKEVRRIRGSTSAAGAQGIGPLSFDEPVPWPEPIAPDVLLDDLAAFFRKHVSLPKHADVACALWTVHTYMFEAFEHTPRLPIISPEKRCGKTTLLSALGRLVAKPLMASNITAPAVYRTVEKFRPTLLVDEADSFLKGNEELRGVINSGHTIGGSAIRLVGDDYEPKSFSTFAPVAIATIGNLPDTILDRGIPVRMKRKKKGEKIARLRDAVGVDELRQKCRRFAQDLRKPPKGSDPEVPKDLNDRAVDNWISLLAIADAAGGPWPMRARQAALALSADHDSDDDTSIRTQLLSDIREIFKNLSSPRIRSQALCDALAEREDRPWPEWPRGKPITPRQLARLLDPFGIKPGTKRGSGTTFKGYDPADFEDAFGRYLPPDPSQRHNP